MVKLEQFEDEARAFFHERVNSVRLEEILPFLEKPDFTSSPDGSFSAQFKITPPKSPNPTLYHVQIKSNHMLVFRNSEDLVGNYTSPQIETIYQSELSRYQAQQELPLRGKIPVGHPINSIQTV